MVLLHKIHDEVLTTGHGFVETATQRYEVSMNMHSARKLASFHKHRQVYLSICDTYTEQAMLTSNLSDMPKEYAVCSIVSVEERDNQRATPPSKRLTIREKTTLTFDSVRRVETHDAFVLEAGDVLFHDRGLKIELLKSVIGGITGVYRMTYENNEVLINGADLVDEEIKMTVKIVSGEASPIYRRIESSGLKWCSMQEWSKETIEDHGVEAYILDYLSEVCQYMSDMFAHGCPMS